MSDPCGEDSHSPVPGLVHRYPDRVLFLVTDRCAAYCRYCTRSRMVSNATGYDFHPEFDRQIEYVRQHPEIRDVLLSGGDPLLLNDEKLEFLLSRLRAIPACRVPAHRHAHSHFPAPAHHAGIVRHAAPVPSACSSASTPIIRAS